MGLDITAYARIKKLDAVFDEDGNPLDYKTREPIADYYQCRFNHDFPGRAEGLEDRAVYSFENSNGAFQMGYGGYNAWRNALAKHAGYPLTPYVSHGVEDSNYAAACWQGATGPFSELINFSDCEGDIGPVVAAKLAKDFADFDERMKSHMTDYHYQKYRDMRACMEMAADGGAVSFH